MSFEICPELLARGFEHGLGRRGADAAAVPGLVTVRQVHGARLLRVPSRETAPRADALFTTEPGVAVGVRTADCVPMLLACTTPRAVAAVHAGWRGAAAGIAERAVREFVAALGAEPEHLLVAIGAHIGPCCYEVDDPVRDAIADASVFRAAEREGHYMLDLFQLNLRQLLAAGIGEERVWRVGGCTSCHPELYPSYRRSPADEHMTHWVRMPAS